MYFRQIQVQEFSGEWHIQGLKRITIFTDLRFPRICNRKSRTKITSKLPGLAAAPAPTMAAMALFSAFASSERNFSASRAIAIRCFSITSPSSKLVVCIFLSYSTAALHTFTDKMISWFSTINLQRTSYNRKHHYCWWLVLNNSHQL